MDSLGLRGTHGETGGVPFSVSSGGQSVGAYQHIEEALGGSTGSQRVLINVNGGGLEAAKGMGHRKQERPNSEIQENSGKAAAVRNNRVGKPPKKEKWSRSFLSRWDHQRAEQLEAGTGWRKNSTATDTLCYRSGTDPAYL